MAEISVEIVFALAESQELLAVSVPTGSTVADVISISGFVECFPQHNLADLAVGIWGRVVENDRTVVDGDRVEIYRPLELNPRDARRKFAEVGRTMVGRTIVTKRND